MRLFVSTEKTILPQRVIEKIKTLLKGLYRVFKNIANKYRQNNFLKNLRGLIILIVSFLFDVLHLVSGKKFSRENFSIQFHFFTRRKETLQIVQKNTLGNKYR
jgi:hypothetical protein